MRPHTVLIERTLPYPLPQQSKIAGQRLGEQRGRPAAAGLRGQQLLLAGPDGLPERLADHLLTAQRLDGQLRPALDLSVDGFRRQEGRMQDFQGFPSLFNVTLDMTREL
ncbi:hypothetical protein [Streptomyces sp. ScaeMP-e48]|uniref:hypothetical protein n=1 Tax=Streptomyces sp. ScaeMP-e48 TaxID=1100823 RepID=UPI001F4DDF9B|nr:hypothetical protein [Streptomyces sp. ScaeMP-e48]